MNYFEAIFYQIFPPEGALIYFNYLLEFFCEENLIISIKDEF